MKLDKEKILNTFKETAIDTLVLIPTIVMIILTALSLLKLIIFLESYNSILLYIVMFIICVFLLLLLLNITHSKMEK